MKNLIVLVVISILILNYGCTKDSDVKKSVSSVTEIIKEFAKPAGLNAEANRILDDIDAPDYTIGIIDNPNFGKFSSHPETDILLGGQSPANITITIDGNNYAPDENGQWLRQSIEFKNYYGKEVALEISDGDSIYSFNIYVPKPALVEQLSSPQSLEIGKTDNDLIWTPDPDNTSGKVALFYELYDNTNIGSIAGLYKRDILMLDDNGSYNIDGLIDSNCKRIFFRMVTGNTASIQSNNKKILFHIASYDHHEYIVN